MKNLTNTLAIILAMLLLTAAAMSQETPPNPQETPAVQQDNRAGLLRELGLTPEQVREIRRANQERKPLMEAAQQRLREANRRLDAAIYADNVNESEVQTFVREAQEAQAEVIRIRSMNELSIRRILNPEQLERFRGLRQRFEQARQNLQERRKQNREMQLKRNPAAAPFRDGAKRLRPLVRQNAPKQ